MKKFLILLFLIPSFIFSGQRFLENQMPEKNPVEIVKEYLNLSEEQVELWIGILENFRVSQREILNQIEPLEQNLRDILGSENPDPQIVGSIVIQIDNLRRQLRENNEIYREDFLLLLNEEQKERYFVLSEAFELAPLFPAFLDTHLI